MEQSQQRKGGTANDSNVVAGTGRQRSQSVSVCDKPKPT